MEGIEQIDQVITLWLNNLSPNWLDPFWALMSHVKFWFPFYGLFMVFALWKLGWKKGLAVIVSIILAVLFVDQFANLVKAGVSRFRPCYDVWMNSNGLRLPYGMQEFYKYGFFSAHAGNSFGFATVSYLGLKWNKPQSDFRIWGWFIFIWAFSMSVSRVMMGAHFLGDITVGALVGLGAGYACAWLCRKVTERV